MFLLHYKLHLFYLFSLPRKIKDIVSHRKACYFRLNLLPETCALFISVQAWNREA